MPRISLKRREYELQDAHSYVKRHLRADGITQTDLGDALGVEQATISYKLNNQALSLGDVLAVIRIGDWSDEDIVKLMRGGKKK